MNKKTILLTILEILLIVLLFVIPSCSIQKQLTIELIVLPPIFFIINRLLSCIYLILSSKPIHVLNKVRTTTKNILLQSIYILLILLVINIFTNSIAYAVKITPTIITAVPPNSIFQWLWFFSSIVILACFEEILFRYFLPEKTIFVVTSLIKGVLSHKKLKSITMLIELVYLIVFALCHCYMGLFAVITSFFCAIIFRFFIKKYNSVLPSCIAHISNNLISFIILFYGHL